MSAAWRRRRSARPRSAMPFVLALFLCSWPGIKTEWGQPHITNPCAPMIVKRVVHGKDMHLNLDTSPPACSVIISYTEICVQIVSDLWISPMMPSLMAFIISSPGHSGLFLSPPLISSLTSEWPTDVAQLHGSRLLASLSKASLMISSETWLLNSCQSTINKRPWN